MEIVNARYWCSSVDESGVPIEFRHLFHGNATSRNHLMKIQFCRKTLANEED